LVYYGRSGGAGYGAFLFIFIVGLGLALTAGGVESLGGVAIMMIAIVGMVRVAVSRSKASRNPRMPEIGDLGEGFEGTAFPPPPPPSSVVVKCAHCGLAQPFAEKCRQCGAPLPSPV